MSDMIETAIPTIIEALELAEKTILEAQAEIAALQARAEAAEAECLEQARLVGMSGERELALRAELERITAQLAEARESERAAVVAWLKSMVTGYPESSAYAHAAFLIEAGEHLT